MRYLTGLVILIAASMACSREPQRASAAAPTAPTATADAAIVFVAGVAGPMDVMFPGRNDPMTFRTALEDKYRSGLGRPATTTYVDPEGEVVWTQEYIRYRVNGCDHGTAMLRVLLQIDGNPPGGICSAPPDGLINFPSRAEIVQFRRELEVKYQQMGRGLSTTFVDMEGAVIWIQEYLRYRVNSCDHATAQQKVFAQVDGGPVAATCFVPCSYTITPSRIDPGYASLSGSFEIRPAPVPCAWTAASDASWLTIASDYRSGNGFLIIPYNITQNNGRDRTGRINFAWNGGSATFVVNQSGTPFNAGFTMNDSFRGATNTTECHFRSSNTPCTLTAFGNLPGGGNYTYDWVVSYLYGNQQRHSLTTSSTNVFTFNNQCGGTGSTSAGTLVDLSVTLVITDSLGNTITLQSGANNQPALFVKTFTC